MRSYCKGLVITRFHVELGYQDWLSKDSGKKNEWRVDKEYGSYDALIDEIYQEISSRTLKFEPIKRYERVEPTNGKIRLIGIESVKQQVCDHLAVLMMAPFLERRIGFYQVASIPGKGQRFAKNTLEKWVLESKYHVKCDIRQCYPSIEHGVAMGILKKYVKSDDLIYLSRTLMNTYGKGLDIGSYFSLKMANLVISFAYHFIESLHKVRRGKRIPYVTHQMWYMDDVLLIGNDKRNLKSAVRQLAKYLEDKLHLHLKRWKIARTSETEPLDIAGWVARVRHPYKTLDDGTKAPDLDRVRVVVSLRSGVFLRGTRAFSKFDKHRSVDNARRCISYWGWFKHADCGGVIRKRHIDRLTSIAKKVVSDYDAKMCEESDSQDNMTTKG